MKTRSFAKAFLAGFVLSAGLVIGFMGCTMEIKNNLIDPASLFPPMGRLVIAGRF
jgi:hypothetical protein